jgi:hypothetical protein
MTSHDHRTLKGGGRAAGSFFSLAAVALLVVIVADAQQQVGFVLNMRGNWVLNSSQSLSPGSPLPAGGRVQVRNPRSGDYIEIVNRGGQVIVNRSCESGGCGQAITLPTASRGVGSRLLEAAMALVASDPVKFAVLLSRGGELREAVVKIAGEQVDLSAVLANKSRGTYLLRFEPRSTGTPANAKPIGPVSVDWEPNKLAPVTISGLTPGLYVVQPLSNEDREPLEPGTESWVLFARPEKFDKAFCDFREAVITTDQWGDATRQVSKRQFLRAALSQLETEAR